MLRLTYALLAVALVVAACTGTPTPEPTPDALSLITEASTKIRSATSFRMSVERTGASYFILTDLGNVAFRRALAQYVAPDVIQASVRLIAAGIPADVDIFARGDSQWYRNAVLTANRWFNSPFAPGFNARTLIAEDTGFEAALNALIGLRMIGLEALEDGSPVYHLTGTADGPALTALMVGMIQAAGDVLVDVYIHEETRYPVRFVIVQPETVTTEEPEPTTWTIDVYDVNAEPVLDDPEVEATNEASP